MRHKWGATRYLTLEEWADVLHMTLTALGTVPFRVETEAWHGGFSINGVGDDAGETFVVDRLAGVNTCNTGGKSYDAVVRKVLAGMAWVLDPAIFVVHSDDVCDPLWSDAWNWAMEYERKRAQDVR